MSIQEALALLRRGEELMRSCGVPVHAFVLPEGNDWVRFTAIRDQARALLVILDHELRLMAEEAAA